MAKSKTKRARTLSPYMRRAAEDQYAQEQLRNAVARLRDVYSRVSKQQAAATEDKRLYSSLKDAAVSIRRAVGRIEEPPAPKHRVRNALVIGIALAGGLALLKRARAGHSEQPLPAAQAGFGDGFAPPPAPEPASSEAAA